MKSSPKSRVLVVEDEINIAKVIEDYFIAAGFDVKTCYDGKEGLDTFKSYQPDLIILDIMLPSMDGFSICKRIRKESVIPIIMLTARTEVEDQLFGYELKVDDYMNKPFSPDVLVAKAKNLLERSMSSYKKTDEMKESNSDLVIIGGIEINRLSREVFIDQKIIELENKQYKILCYFIENQNIVLTREQIMDTIWGYDNVGTSRAVDAQITKLRQKLKHKAYCIKTVFGVGYKFEVKK